MSRCPGCGFRNVRLIGLPCRPRVRLLPVFSAGQAYHSVCRELRLEPGKNMMPVNFLLIVLDSALQTRHYRR